VENQERSRVRSIPGSGLGGAESNLLLQMSVMEVLAADLQRSSSTPLRFRRRGGSLATNPVDGQVTRKRITEPALISDLVSVIPDHIWFRIFVLANPVFLQRLHPTPTSTVKFDSSAKLTFLRPSELKTFASLAMVSRFFRNLIRTFVQNRVECYRMDICFDSASASDLVIRKLSKYSWIVAQVNHGGRHNCSSECAERLLGALQTKRVAEVVMNTGWLKGDTFNHIRWIASFKEWREKKFIFKSIACLKLRGTRTPDMWDELAELVNPASLQNLTLLCGPDQGEDPSEKGRSRRKSSTSSLSTSSTSASTTDTDVSTLAKIDRFRSSLQSLQVDDAIFRICPKVFSALSALRSVNLTSVFNPDEASGVPLDREGLVGFLHSLPNIRTLNIAAGSSSFSPGRHPHKLGLLEIPSLSEVTLGVFRLGVDEPPIKFLKSLPTYSSSGKPGTVERPRLRRIKFVFRDLPSRSRKEFLIALSQHKDAVGIGRAARVLPSSVSDSWQSMELLSKRTGTSLRAVNLEGEELMTWRVLRDSDTNSLSS